MLVSVAQMIQEWLYCFAICHWDSIYIYSRRVWVSDAAAVAIVVVVVVVVFVVRQEKTFHNSEVEVFILLVIRFTLLLYAF